VGGRGVYRGVRGHDLSPVADNALKCGSGGAVWAGLGAAVDSGGGLVGGSGGLCLGTGGRASLGQTVVGAAVGSLAAVCASPGGCGSVLAAFATGGSLRRGELWGGTAGGFLAGLPVDVGAGNGAGGSAGGVAGQWRQLVLAGFRGRRTTVVGQAAVVPSLKS
jgi:hypothetical protein